MTVLFYEVQSHAYEEPRAFAVARDARIAARECKPYAAAVDKIETTLKGRELYAALANGEKYVSKRTRILTLDGDANAFAEDDDDKT